VPTLYLVVVSALVALIAYRTYRAFLAASVATLDHLRCTPAHALRDGRDYVPTNRRVLFGHRFAAIAGAGPLIRIRAWRGLAPAILFSALATGAWGYLVWTGTISTLWPLLGAADQLLAAFALAIGTSVLINVGRGRHVWCTLVPLAFMCVNALSAGWLDLSVNYLAPQLRDRAPGLWAAFLTAPGPAKIQSVLTLAIMGLLVVVILDGLARWTAVVRSRRSTVQGPAERIPEPLGL